MSFFAFALWKIFSRGSDRKNIPFTAQVIGLSLPVLARTFLLNGIGGIGFGYLYWKRGLAYSICAHASTHVFINQTDVLEILDILTELGIKDPRMDEAIDLVISCQDEMGRWRIRNTYNSDRLLIPFGKNGEQSKWLTLRAMRILKRYFSQ